MTRLSISPELLERTLVILKAGRLRHEERMAAWIGKGSATGRSVVRDVYEPEQVCRKDRFHLPPESMTSLMRELGRTRSGILAQIHTHPGRAFHSRADAAWAIIRHVGALSLVLPNFAGTTTVGNFLEQVMVYEYSPSAEWILVPTDGPDGRLEIAA